VTEPSARADDGPATDAQLQAMISLVTDRSAKVAEGSLEALVAQGEHALASLDARLPDAEGLEERRLRQALARIRHPLADAKVLEALRGAPELESGALLVARVVDGGPQPDQAADALDALARRVDELLMDDESSNRQLAVLRQVLVTESELRGAPGARMHPLNALLHGALTRPGAMPLPLCMVWLLVARRVGIPLHGVNMPGHFLLGLEAEKSFVLLDAYTGGLLIDEATVARQLAAHGAIKSSARELVCDDREMLLRTLRNLVHLAASDRDRQLALRATRILARSAGMSSGVTGQPEG